MMANILSAPDLLDVVEDVDDVAVATRGLFDLAGQGQAGHGHDVKRQPDQRLGVVESLEEDAPGGHRNLRR